MSIIKRSILDAVDLLVSIEPQNLYLLDLNFVKVEDHETISCDALY